MAKSRSHDCPSCPGKENVQASLVLGFPSVIWSLLPTKALKMRGLLFQYCSLEGSASYTGPVHGGDSDFSLLKEIPILVLDLLFPLSFYQHYHA